MPSLPTSLIIVGLVVAWLVVLVPMVAKRREHVPENIDEGANFHVLQRDSKSRRRPILSRTAMAHRSRGDAGEYDEYDAAPGDAFDEDSAGDSGDVGSGVTGGLSGGADASNGTQPDVCDDDAADEYRGTRVGAVDERVEGLDNRLDGDGAGDAVFETPRYSVPQRARYDAAHGAADVRFETDRESRRAERAPIRESNSVGDDAEYRRTPIRQGRGGFDPAAADRARDHRFRQRQRVALLLVILAVAGAVVGYVGSGYGYAASVASVVLLVLYLAYLRRQVRIEAEIRRRREARLARARQIRPGYRPSVAEQVYAHRTGEFPRPGEVDGYRVSSHVRQTVPPSGYGYGEPIDFEDSDPAFDDLEYYRPAAYRRRAG